MKRQTKYFMNEICDNIEIMLKEATPKDRWQSGIELCQFIATFATDKYNATCATDEMLLPAKLLNEAKTQLIEIIDRQFLDALGEMCVAEAKKEKEGTAS